MKLKEVGLSSFLIQFFDFRVFLLFLSILIMVKDYSIENN